MRAVCHCYSSSLLGRPRLAPNPSGRGQSSWPAKRANGIEPFFGEKKAAFDAGFLLIEPALSLRLFGLVKAEFLWEEETFSPSSNQVNRAFAFLLYIYNSYACRWAHALALLKATWCAEDAPSAEERWLARPRRRVGDVESSSYPLRGADVLPADSRCRRNRQRWYVSAAFHPHICISAPFAPTPHREFPRAHVLVIRPLVNIYICFIAARFFRKAYLDFPPLRCILYSEFCIFHREPAPTIFLSASRDIPMDNTCVHLVANMLTTWSRSQARMYTKHCRMQSNS